jgi:lysophospholipase L1-like esterase
MSGRRRAVFAATTVALTVALLSGLLAIVDVVLHWRYERTAAVNVWGYRGPTIGAKAPGEIRVVVLGGSAAFGYGMTWDEAFPYYLEQRLNDGGDGRRYSVVNLAFNNETAHSFRPVLEDYRYLDYDVAILYEGYNDLLERPRSGSFRRDSAVFRLTGYLPIFPMVFREKAFALAYGDVDRGYQGEGAEQTVFRPGLADRVAAGALTVAVETAESLERQIGRLTRDVREEAAATPATNCDDTWRRYCDAVFEGVSFARREGTKVIVGTQPYVSDLHIDQQRALTGMLQQQFAGDAGVLHANMGAVIDLRDPSLAYDGMHLTAEGNRRLAEAFVGPVLRMVQEG